MPCHKSEVNHGLGLPHRHVLKESLQFAPRGLQTCQILQAGRDDPSGGVRNTSLQVDCGVSFVMGGTGLT
eukprot:5698635-Alexandrium_andersonii.AAC.1